MHNLTGAHAQALEKCMRMVRNYIMLSGSEVGPYTLQTVHVCEV